MRAECAALALALLARRGWRRPRRCVLPPDVRTRAARELVAGYVGGQDFRRLVEGAGEAAGAVPLAVAPPAVRARTGAASAELALPAAVARSAWTRTGPGRPRLAWGDWLLAQRLLDEARPDRRDGAWEWRSELGGDGLEIALDAEVLDGTLTVRDLRRLAGSAGGG